MPYVLLVDDRDDNLEYLRALLQGSHFQVETANQGVEALAKARENAPTLVISDLLMPIMDGYTLLRHWKSDPLLKDVPFIVYTATYTEPEDERLALNLGADAFILKPAEPKDFLARIHQVLNNSVASVSPSVKRPGVEEHTLLKQYSEALIRKLEEKTRQLEESNRALQVQIIERSEIAQTQIAILNALPARVALVDSQGVIVAVNESWRRFAAANVPTAPEFGVGQNYLGICDNAEGSGAPEPAEVAAGIRSVLRGESRGFAVEYPCQAPMQEGWFRMMVTALHSNRSAGAVVMHIDISDRKDVELRLRESQEEYLLLLNSTAEGIYGLDLNGVCTFCNLAAARLLGYQRPEEIVGQSVHEHHHHSLADGKPLAISECRVHHAFRSGEETHADNEVFHRKDGTHFPVEYWAHPIRRDTDILGAVVAFQDISERRSLEAQFLQAQKMEAVGQLAGGVAHDFNNALQVVITCSELLDERLIGHPVEREYIREIQAAGERGATLTRQLLAFSRKQLLRPVLLNLNVVVDGIQEMLRRMIGEDIELKVAYEANVRAIEADAGQIEQVLMNLAVNARDAMPHGGELVISTSNIDTSPEETQRYSFAQAGHYVMLSIRDTGCGMDAATQSRIFEPFFTTKEAGKGTGLGLSTVYGIVKQSGGFIEVDSKPDKGTHFRIYFPSADGTPEQVVLPPQRDGNRGGTESILLVEDERSLRTLVSTALRASGYTVFEAQNGRAGIAIGGQSDVRIDLLVTDVILPDLSGPQVAEHLVASHPSLKVLYISGYTDDYISHLGVMDDATLLLQKPFSIGSLLAKIREALDTKPLERS